MRTKGKKKIRGYLYPFKLEGFGISDGSLVEGKPTYYISPGYLQDAEDVGWLVGQGNAYQVGFFAYHWIRLFYGEGTYKTPFFIQGLWWIVNGLWRLIRAGLWFVLIACSIIIPIGFLLEARAQEQRYS